MIYHVKYKYFVDNSLIPICSANQWTGLYIIRNLATLLKVTLLHGCISHFLNCTNDTKLRKASQILKSCRLQLATLLKVSLSNGCFSCFFKLYKRWQIAQSVTFNHNKIFFELMVSTLWFNEKVRSKFPFTIFGWWNQIKKWVDFPGSPNFSFDKKSKKQMIIYGMFNDSSR